MPTTDESIRQRILSEARGLTRPLQPQLATPTPTREDRPEAVERLGTEAPRSNGLDRRYINDLASALNRGLGRPLRAAGRLSQGSTRILRERSLDSVLSVLDDLDEVMAEPTRPVLQRIGEAIEGLEPGELPQHGKTVLREDFMRRVIEKREREGRPMHKDFAASTILSGFVAFSDYFADAGMAIGALRSGGQAVRGLATVARDVRAAGLNPSNAKRIVLAIADRLPVAQLSPAEQVIMRSTREALGPYANAITDSSKTLRAMEIPGVSRELRVRAPEPEWAAGGREAAEDATPAPRAAEPPATQAQPTTEPTPPTATVPENIEDQIALLGDFIEKEVAPRRVELQAERSAALAGSGYRVGEVVEQGATPGAGRRILASTRGTGYGDWGIQDIRSRLGQSGTDRLRDSLEAFIINSPVARAANEGRRNLNTRRAIQTLFEILPSGAVDEAGKLRYEAKMPAPAEAANLRRYLGLDITQSRAAIRDIEGIAELAGNNTDEAAVLVREVVSDIREGAARTQDFTSAIGNPAIAAKLERLRTIFSARIPVWAEPVRGAIPSAMRSSQMERRIPGMASIPTNQSPEIEALARRVEAAMNRASRQTAEPSSLERLVDRARAQTEKIVQPGAPPRGVRTPVDSYVDEAALRQTIEAAQNGDEDAIARLFIQFPESTGIARQATSMAEARRMARSVVSEIRTGPGKQLADALRVTAGDIRLDRINKINELTERINAGDRAAAEELTEIVRGLEAERATARGAREAREAERIASGEGPSPAYTDDAATALNRATRLVRRQAEVERLLAGIAQVSEPESHGITKTLRALADVIGIQRLLVLGGDLSAIRNQTKEAGQLSLIRDIITPGRRVRDNAYLRSIGDAFAVYRNPAQAAEIAATRQTDKYYDLIVGQAGLFESALDAPVGQAAEEVLQSRGVPIIRQLADRVPLIFRGNAATNSFLNDFSYNYVKQMAQMYEYANKVPPPLEMVQGWVTAMNTARGRARSAEMAGGTAMNIASTMWRAPRYWLSRGEMYGRAVLGTPGARQVFEFVTDNPLSRSGIGQQFGLNDLATWAKSPQTIAANEEMAKMVGSNLALYGMVGGAAYLSGVGEIQLDPRHRNFGRVRVGNIDSNPFGPATALIRMVSQTASKSRINEDGTVTALTGRTIEDMWDSYNENQKNEAVASLIALATRGEIGREQISSIPQVSFLAVKSMMPLFMKTAVEQYMKTGLAGIPTNLVMTPLSWVGENVNYRPHVDTAGDDPYASITEESGQEEEDPYASMDPSSAEEEDPYASMFDESETANATP